MLQKVYLLFIVDKQMWNNHNKRSITFDTHARTHRDSFLQRGLLADGGVQPNELLKGQIAALVLIERSRLQTRETLDVCARHTLTEQLHQQLHKKEKTTTEEMKTMGETTT